MEDILGIPLALDAQKLLVVFPAPVPVTKVTQSLVAAGGVGVLVDGVSPGGDWVTGNPSLQVPYNPVRVQIQYNS